MKILRLFFSVLLLSIVSFSSVCQSIKRIVSLAPSLTMNLYYLDLKEEVVGCTSYCEIAKPDKKPIVGSAVSVNVEKILSLKPDLVLAAPITRTETIEMLRKLGLRVELFPIPDSFDEICNQFLRLGKIVGQEELAKQIIAEQQQKVNKIRHSNVQLQDKMKMFIQIGAKPLFGVIPHTFMDDYITFCGSENVAYDFKNGIIGRETVLARNPDVIFIVTMGIIGDEEKENWKNYPDLKAAKHNNIFIIDSNMACTPTPLSFVRTLEEMNRLIHHTIK